MVLPHAHQDIFQQMHTNVSFCFRIYNTQTSLEHNIYTLNTEPACYPSSQIPPWQRYNDFAQRYIYI